MATIIEQAEMRSGDIQENVIAITAILDLVQPAEMREIFENKLSIILTNAHAEIKLLSTNIRAAVDISRYLATEWRIREINSER